MSFGNIPTELLPEIFIHLPVTFIKKFARLSKNVYNMVFNDITLKKWNHRQYPLLKNCNLNLSALDALKKSFVIFHKNIKPINLVTDQAIILKLAIIEKMLNIRLPVNNNDNSLEIISYLRCDLFPITTLAKLLSVSHEIKKQIPLKVTLFVHVKNEIQIDSQNRIKLNISLEELFNNIIPVNIKSDQLLIDDKIRVFTIVFHNNTSQIYYSKYNFHKTNLMILFNQVRHNFNAIYKN